MFLTGTWQTPNCSFTGVSHPMCSQHLSQGKGLPPALHHTSFIPNRFCAWSDDYKHSHKLLQSLQALPRPIPPGSAGVCFMKVPLLPASQDNHWSSVWKEGKDGRGIVIDVCSSPYLFLSSFCCYCRLSLYIISLWNISLCGLVRCNQQYLLSLAWHKCLRRLTAGPHVGCNI